jgi:hypothetical protein
VTDPIPKLGDEQTNTAFARWLAIAYATMTLGFILYVAWVAIRSHYTAPNVDDWRILDDLFSSPLLNWIFENQNGHRVPVTLTLFFLDYRFFDGHMHLLTLASLACTGLAIAILVRTLRTERATRDPVAIIWISFACFLLSWAASRHDLAWGMNQGTLMAAMWCTVCVTCIAVVLHQKNRGETLGTLPLVAAAVAAVFATFSQGVGFSCWAGLLVLAVVVRLPIRVTALYAIGAAITLGVYISGVEIPMYDSPKMYTELVTRLPGRLIEFTVALVGASASALTPSGWVDDVRNVALTLGATGITIFGAFTAFTLFRRPHLSSFDLFAIGLPTTAIIGGLMIALNRHFWPDHAIDLRFSTWSALFWVGLAFIPPAICARSTTKSPRLAIVSALLVFVMSVQFTVNLQTAHTAQRVRTTKLNYLSTMHLLGIQWDQWPGGTLVKEPERVYRVAERLRQESRSFFTEARARYPGSSIAKDFKIIGSKHCEGGMSSATPIQTRDGLALVVSGWAKSRKSERKIDQILITGQRGIIEGLASFVHRDATLTHTKFSPQDDPWAGFLRHPKGNPPYRAFALFDDGESVCKLDIKFPNFP